MLRTLGKLTVWLRSGLCAAVCRYAAAESSRRTAAGEEVRGVYCGDYCETDVRRLTSARVVTCEPPGSSSCLGQRRSTTRCRSQAFSSLGWREPVDRYEKRGSDFTRRKAPRGEWSPVGFGSTATAPSRSRLRVQPLLKTPRMGSFSRNDR